MHLKSRRRIHFDGVKRFSYPPPHVYLQALSLPEKVSLILVPVFFLPIAHFLTSTTCTALSRYCECYANLEVCNPACQCVDCGNRGKEAEHRILSSKAKRVATANAGKIPRNWNLAQSMEPGRENQQGFNGRQSSSAAHPESPIEDGSNFPGEARDTAVGAQPEASKWDAMRLQTSQLPQRVQVMAAEAFLKGSGIPPSTNILSSQHAVSTAWPYVHAGGTSKAAEAGATPTAECAVSQLKESLQGQPGQE